MKIIITLSLCVLFLTGMIHNTTMQGDVQTFISAVAWSRDGSKIAIGYGVSGVDYCYNSEDIYAIHLIDTVTNQTTELKGHTCNVEGLTFNSTGTKLISQGWDGLTILWDIDTGAYEFRSLTFNRLYDVDWQNNGNYILSVNELTVLVKPTDPLKGSISSFRISDGMITDADWSPADKFIVHSDTNGNVTAWNALSEDVLSSFQGHNTSVEAVAWNPNGDTIASADVNGVIKIWNASNGSVVQTITGHTGAIRDLSWSPNGKLLSSASEDATMRVWNVETGVQVASFAYTGPVLTTAWNPAAAQIAYGGVNNQSVSAASAEIVTAPQLVGLDAHAGADQTVLSSGSAVTVTLDGSQSQHSLGTITGYSWKENGVEIAQGVSPQVSLAPGIHTITLTVTADDNSTDTDDVVITVELPTPTPTITFTPATPTDTPIPPTATLPPVAVPENFTAITESQTSIATTWTLVSDATYYEIERSLDGSTNWDTGQSASYLLRWNALSCGTTYYFRIRAYRETDNAYSPYSNIVTGTTTACPTATFTPIPPTPTFTATPVVRSGQIVYQGCVRQGTPIVYRLCRNDSDGTDKAYILEGNNIHSPAIGAGNRLAYVVTTIIDRGASTENIFIYEGNPNSRPIQITSGTLDTDPAWNPAGTRLAFASRTNSGSVGTITRYAIKTVNPDGSNLQTLTSFAGISRSPSWSPDGTKIVFHSDHNGGDNEIFVMNADGTNAVQITDNTFNDIDPYWSSTGKIVFSSNRDGNQEIYTMNPDGMNVVRLTNNPAADVEPKWSPDGHFVVFASNRTAPNATTTSTQYMIFTMLGSDGSDIQQTTQTPGSGESYRNPDWGYFTSPALCNTPDEVCLD